VLFLVAWLAMSVGVPMRSPRKSGSAAFPAGRRGGVVEHGVAAGSGGDAHVVSEAGEVSGAVGGVADEVNCPGGEGFCDLVEEVAAEVGFAAARL